VSGLVLNFVDDPRAALAEMARVTRGTIAAYVWDYAGEMQMLRHFWDAVSETALDEAARFPLCTRAAMGALFDEVRAIDIETRFTDFDDYWQPFLGGVGPAPAYVASLDLAARERLRDRVRARLPIAPDGSIALVARAWAARRSR
jgi:hypothetical protein